MNIHLNLNNVDEVKMREVMKKEQRLFILAEVKRWFLEELNRNYKN
tara:strand:+ start:88 stop:225 length:138 start_codon:yes stop_codon:yes gene_type:complete